MIDVDPELGPVKRCPKCGDWWPVDGEFFYRTTNTPTGFQSWCIACSVSEKAKRRKQRGVDSRRVEAKR